MGDKGGRGWRDSLAGQTSRLVGVVSESLSLATPTGRLAHETSGGRGWGIREGGGGG